VAFTVSGKSITIRGGVSVEKLAGSVFSEWLSCARNTIRSPSRLISTARKAFGSAWLDDANSNIAHTMAHKMALRPRLLR
jgi:hypothetical protein